MIDLRRLQVLRLLDERGSVSAVSEALNLTPSAVSQQIRHLAGDVGVDLVQRHGRGVRLTAAARVLLDRSDLLYAQWEQALADVTATGVGAGRHLLRLCGFPTALAGLLAPAAARLRDSADPQRTEVIEAGSPECFERLLVGRADVAVVVPGPSNPALDDPRFEQEVLLDDPFDLLVPADHPLVDHDAVDLAEVATQPWIAAPERSDDHVVVVAACAAAGFTPHVVHRAEEWNAVVALVTHGFGVSLMPRLAPIPPHHAVVRIGLRNSPSRRVLTAVRRGSRGQPRIARGVEALHQVGRQLPPPLRSGKGHENDASGEGGTPHRHTYRR